MRVIIESIKSIISLPEGDSEKILLSTPPNVIILHTLVTLFMLLLHSCKKLKIFPRSKKGVARKAISSTQISGKKFLGYLGPM